MRQNILTNIRVSKRKQTQTFLFFFYLSIVKAYLTLFYQLELMNVHEELVLLFLSSNQKQESLL